MGGFNLGSNAIEEIGVVIGDLLNKYGYENEGIVTLSLSDDEFKKVDEDLFYRNREDDKEEFTPSDNEINVKVGSILIVLKKKS